MTVALDDFALSVKLPSISVTVTFCVPFSVMEAPMIGSPLASTTLPESLVDLFC